MCDLIIILGSILNTSITAFSHKNFAKNAKKIMVDIDRNEINLVLIPRDKIKEDKMKNAEYIWKIRFYDRLESLKLKYDFEFLDFKDQEYILAVREYYSDLEHLNYDGGVTFTNMLRSKIQ